MTTDEQLRIIKTWVYRFSATHVNNPYAHYGAILYTEHSITTSYTDDYDYYDEMINDVFHLVKDSVWHSVK